MLERPSGAGPEYLEDLRALINTWRIPNDTREVTDDLAAVAADPSRWAVMLARLPQPEPEEIAELMALRDALRAQLGGAPVGLNEWLQRCPVRVQVAEDGALQWSPEREGTVGRALAVFAEILHRDHWRRLRACGDCQWVFFDQSKSNTKRWCRMYAGESGRACGSIAKVKAYRERRKDAAADPAAVRG
jgi:predicted RNA-binding Zn ribbon-like protein